VDEVTEIEVGDTVLYYPVKSEVQNGVIESGWKWKKWKFSWESRWRRTRDRANIWLFYYL